MDSTKTDQVREWIISFLKAGPRRASTVKRTAYERGCGQRMFSRAMRPLLESGVVESYSTPEHGKPNARSYRLSRVTQ